MSPETLPSKLSQEPVVYHERYTAPSLLEGSVRTRVTYNASRTTETGTGLVSRHCGVLDEGGGRVMSIDSASYTTLHWTEWVLEDTVSEVSREKSVK